ncbi:MAG: DUF748 domain-containing protein [Nannocystaceae bacterium]
MSDAKTDEETQDSAEAKAEARRVRRRLRRRRRRRRTAVLLALVLVGLVILWALSPTLITTWIVQAVEARTRGRCSIAHVDVRVFSGGVVIEGFKLTDRTPTRSRTALTIAVIEADWGWRRLLFEGGGVDVRVDGLEFTVDMRTPWSELIERTSREPPLGVIRSLDLRGGRLSAVLEGAPRPVVDFVDVEATLRVTAFGAGDVDTMTSHVKLVGTDPGGGRLEVQASFAPLAPREVWSLEADAERVDLRPFTPIFRRIFAMDVDHGAITAHAKITQTRGHRRGRIDHSFHDLHLFTPGDVEIRYRMAEALFGAMLSSADQPLIIDQESELATSPAGLEPLDLRAGLDDAAYGDALERITGIIHRGYERRLNSLSGYEVTIDGLDVDFAHNTLSFNGIEVRKIGFKDGPPFFTLEELIVNIEQTIIDREIDTYKEVTLVRPRITFVAGLTPEESQLNFDPDWVDKISAMPYPTDSLTVRGGELEYRDLTGEAPIILGVQELEVAGRSLARGVDPAAPEPLSVDVSAKVVNGGELASKLRLRPRVVPPQGRFEFTLSKTPLVPLNPVARRYAQIDSSSGAVAVDLAASLDDGLALSVIVATFEDLELLGAGEQHRRPLRELMIERRLRELNGKPIFVEAPASTLEEFRDTLPRTLVRAVLDASKSSRPPPPELGTWLRRMEKRRKKSGRDAKLEERKEKRRERRRRERETAQERAPEPVDMWDE